MDGGREGRRGCDAPGDAGKMHEVQGEEVGEGGVGAMPGILRFPGGEMKVLENEGKDVAEGGVDGIPTTHEQIQGSFTKRDNLTSPIIISIY